jgi:hypothetical protein
MVRHKRAREVFLYKACVYLCVRSSIGGCDVPGSRHLGSNTHLIVLSISSLPVCRERRPVRSSRVQEDRHSHASHPATKKPRSSALRFPGAVVLINSPPTPVSWEWKPDNIKPMCCNIGSVWVLQGQHARHLKGISFALESHEVQASSPWGLVSRASALPRIQAWLDDSTRDEHLRRLPVHRVYVKGF